MVEIRPTIVFGSRLEKDANRIVSGDMRAIIPFHYGLHRGFKVFLFFPDILPAPKLFDAVITEVMVGSPVELQKLALQAGKDAYVVMDAAKNCQAITIFWEAVPVPLSQEEVVNRNYAEGNLPIPE